MFRQLAVAAAVFLSAAAMPVGAMAAHGGGGGRGGGGFGGGHGIGGGGHSFSGGGLGGRSFSPGMGGRSFSPGMGGRSFSPGGNAFVNRGAAGRPLARNPQGAHTPFTGRTVTRNGRFAFDGRHRIRGRHLFGFIPGFGYDYYWYYGDCWAWTDHGWVDVCVDGDYPAP